MEDNTTTIDKSLDRFISGIFIGIIFIFIIGIFLGYSFCNNQYKTELIENNLGGYNYQTGQFQLNTNLNNK